MVEYRGYTGMERAPKTLVIDASVVAKWFIPEKETEKATEIRNGHVLGKLTLVAPDLLIYEVINALRFHNEITESKLGEDIEDLFMLDLELIQPSSELVSSIASDSRRYGISVYDACYLTLAGVLGTSMVTADAKLYEKCQETGRVLMLDDLGHKWAF